MSGNIKNPKGRPSYLCVLGLLAGVGASGWSLIAAPGISPKPGAAWPMAVGAKQRPGAYWWCPGSAFTKADRDWNLEQFRDAGFGFVHLIPIYGARGGEARDINYLSPQWMEMFDFTVRQARSLGLFVDMTTGTGWCFGGPNLSGRCHRREGALRCQEQHGRIGASNEGQTRGTRWRGADAQPVLAAGHDPLSRTF